VRFQIEPSVTNIGSLQKPWKNIHSLMHCSSKRRQTAQTPTLTESVNNKKLALHIFANNY